MKHLWQRVMSKEKVKNYICYIILLTALKNTYLETNFEQIQNMK